MSELGSGSGSSYPGALDTDSTQEVNSPNAGKTKARAEVVNDLASAIVAIQTELGVDPAGSLSNVVTWLQTQHGADGTHGAITPTSIDCSGTVQWFKGSDVASATALTLGSGNYFDVTGTTAITSIDTVGIGTVTILHFDAILTLTHHATDLILPGAANITTAAGDEAIFIEYATGDWRCVNYTYAVGPGTALQVVNTTDGAVNTGSTVLPTDDSIPQNTEGDEYMTLAITPRSTSNILVIEVICNVSSTVNDKVSIALFQDSTAAALGAITERPVGGAELMNLSLVHKMAAGTTSETTFKLRAGAESAGTTTFNGESGSRIFGGVIASSITITEYKA